MGEYKDNNNLKTNSIEYINFLKNFDVDKIEIGIRNYSITFVFEDLTLAEGFINYLLNKKDEGGYTGDIDNFLKKIARLSPALKQLITKLLIKKINENPKSKLLVDDIKRLLEELKNIDYENNILEDGDVLIINGKRFKDKDITNVRKNLNKINEDNRTKKQNTSSKDSLNIKTIRKEAALARKEFLEKTTRSLKHVCKIHNTRKACGKEIFGIFSSMKKALGTLLNNNKLRIKSNLNIGKGGISVESSGKGFGLGFGKGSLGEKDRLGLGTSKAEGKNTNIGTTKSEDINKSINKDNDINKDINKTVGNSNNIGKDNNYNDKSVNNLNNNLNNNQSINKNISNNKGNSQDNNTVSNNITNNNPDNVQINTNNNHNIFDKLKDIIPGSLLEKDNKQKESAENLENINKDNNDNKKDKEKSNIPESIEEKQKEEKENNNISNAENNDKDNDIDDIYNMLDNICDKKSKESNEEKTDSLKEEMSDAEKGIEMTNQLKEQNQSKTNQENQKIVGEHSKKYIEGKNSNDVSGPSLQN